MRVVLDTVVFVRSLINPKGRWGSLVFDHSGDYVLLLSPDVIEEILEVVHRPELRRRFPEMARPPVIDRLLERLRGAEVIEPRERFHVCRDPKDNKFFECAVAAGAGYIVSEDRDILDVGEFRGVKTVTAEEFVAILTATP